MIRAFLDTNVVVDYMTKREGFYDAVESNQFLNILISPEA